MRYRQREPPIHLVSALSNLSTKAGTISVAFPCFASAKSERPSDGSRLSSIVCAPLARASATNPAAG